MSVVNDFFKVKTFGPLKIIIASTRKLSVVRPLHESSGRITRPGVRSFRFNQPDDSVSPPGYWRNQRDGRELRTFIRNDSYTPVTGQRSRLEIPVGEELKAVYGFGPRERLRLEVTGRPRWNGKPGRLEIYFDDLDEKYRAIQPVRVGHKNKRSDPAENVAALDIGANNLVACTTTEGDQYLYECRGLFERFRETTEEIGRLQAKLPEGRTTSRRIRRLYRKRSHRRNHAQAALVRDLLSRLDDSGIGKVIVGDLTHVLSRHWSTSVNEKTHQFWAYRSFMDRLITTAEEFGLDIEITSEAWTSHLSELWSAGADSATGRLLRLWMWI